MTEIMMYVNAIFDLILGFVMLAIMGFLLYLLGLAIVTMVRNKQPRWDAIIYVIAILMLGLAMWRFFPTIAIRTMRVSLEEARPEVLLLQDEVRQWIPQFELTLPAPVTATLTVPDYIPSPTFISTPVVVVVTVTSAVATPIPATVTPYPTYTPWPTATPLPTATPCLVNVGGTLLACPPTPVIGGE